MAIIELKPNKKSKFNKKRKGRGNASGKGGECGRGHKGQKSRSGYSRRSGFEGGQMPLYKRIPKKKGFNNGLFKIKFDVVNISQIDKLFNENDVITIEMLTLKGLVSGKNKIKLLGNGKLTKKVNITVNAISESARSKIEKLKGSYSLV